LDSLGLHAGILTMEQKRRKERMMVAGVLLFGLFNVPLLTVFNKKVLFHGIPLLFFYVASVWVFGILMLYFIVERRSENNRNRNSL
jgi:predicted RND superfamily exporter protein